MPAERVGMALDVRWVATAVALAVALDLAYWLRNRQPQLEFWSVDHNPAFSMGSEVCSIDRVPEADLSLDVFLRSYWNRQPLIIDRAMDQNTAAQNASLKKELLRTKAEMNLTLVALEGYGFTQPKAAQLGQYIQDMYRHRNIDGSARGQDFHWQFGDDLGIGSVYRPPQIVEALLQSGNAERLGTYQLALGGPGSGLPFHFHTESVFAETLHGQRRWFLYPRNVSPTGGFNPRMSSSNWLKYVYPSLRVTGPLRQCMVAQGQAIYFPQHWFHSTISLGESVSISSFLFLTQAQKTEEEQLYARVIDALKHQEYQTGFSLALELTELNLGSFVPWSLLGLSAGFVEDFGTATKAFQHCVDLNPLFAACRVMLARALTRLDRKSEALPHWQRAAELSSMEDDELLLA